MKSYKQYLIENPPAWHGSPHDHDAFSVDAIGTGEGAQAYGWGLYFATDKDVAEWYRDKLSIEERYVDGEPLDVYNPKHHLALILAEESGDVQAAKETLEFLITRGGSKNIKDLAQKSLELLLKGITPQISYRKPKGKLYHVDIIPNDDKFLDWNKLIGEQSEYVLKRLGLEIDTLESKFLEYRKKLISKFGMRFRNKLSQQEIEEYEKLKRIAGDNVDLKMIDGQGVYKNNQKELGSSKAASLYLLSLGIKGIKYLDGNSRNITGKNSYNYVVFDDKDVKIIEKI